MRSATEARRCSMSSNSQKTLLLDTNVWVDYYSNARPGHKAAFELVSLALKSGFDLLYAVGSAKDVFYLVSCDFKHASRRVCGGALSEEAANAAKEMAWAVVRNMQSIATAVGCDQSDMWLAEKHRQVHDDFEDDLVIAAAMHSDAGCLVTNDEKLLRHCPVAALSVDDAVRFASMG